MNDFENEKKFEDREPEVKNTDAPEENGAPDPVLEEKAACENASCPERAQGGRRMRNKKREKAQRRNR